MGTYDPVLGSESFLEVVERRAGVREDLATDTIDDLASTEELVVPARNRSR